MIEQPIVILGGKGMLGQDLAQVFSDKRTFVWDRDDVDITDIDALREKLQYFAPRTVINAAAYNAVDAIEEHEEDRAIATAVNAVAAGSIATICRKINATLVHFSTDYVFEGSCEEGYTEDAQPNPQSDYARSKFAGETAVLHSGAKAFVVRTSRLFGHAGMSAVSKKSFVDTMMRLASERDELDAVDEEVSSPTYTPDLAAQVRVLLDGDYMPGIYHMSNSGACTWYEFAQEIFRVTNASVTVNPVNSSAFPRPAARPRYSVLMNTKLPALRTWQEALADYLSNNTRS